MEFFKRLKELIPTVLASDTDTSKVNVISDSNTLVSSNYKNETHQNQTENTEESVLDKEIDLKTRPEKFSDVLVNKQYEYYPERDNKRYKPKLWNKIARFEGREEFSRMSCEKKIYKMIKEEPLIKLLIGALKTAGCDIDIRRNFSCEVCYSGICGGYDTATQQVVMCMNNISSEPLMATILAHELIHMYDHCVNDTDFTKTEHLACTEIRAINLTSCGLTDSFFAGFVGVMDLIKKDYGKKHSSCVKERALRSVMAASPDLSEEQARQTIEKVFPYCYIDLEPIGRRMRDNSDDNERAYLDGKHYGYV